MFRQTAEFRQTDVNDGSIYYMHEAGKKKVTADGFVFQVFKCAPKI